MLAASCASLAWAYGTSRWEWALLSILSLILAAAWGRDGRDPGTAALITLMPLLALPTLGIIGLGEDILSPLAVLGGVGLLYFISLSFVVLVSLRTSFRPEPSGLLFAAFLTSVSVSTLAQLGAYYADLLMNTSLLDGNAAFMWPLFFNLWGALVLTVSLAWSGPALRLLNLPEAG